MENKNTDFPVELIVTDIDDTIALNGKPVHPKIIDRLLKFDQVGVKLGFNTGRPLDSGLAIRFGRFMSVMADKGSVFAVGSRSGTQIHYFIDGQPMEDEMYLKPISRRIQYEIKRNISELINQIRRQEIEL